ncbi:hypothetical protein DPMN_167240 [Dreissena polymorpha]|uniref:Uncharacterized protein n=1 Tax=Dreissena polymorpha TaxID=45954 RepID=A0A9D4EZG4_DREPO|nr:hypothetical protein DPMN_167240 [Dreissena polymorpha]
MGDTQNAIAEFYADFTDKQQGLDGYEDSPYIKDITHQRRTQKCKLEHEHVDHAKFSIFSRDKNKAGMITMITTALTKRGCYVLVSPGGADNDIIKATLE